MALKFDILGCIEWIGIYRQQTLKNSQILCRLRSLCIDSKMQGPKQFVKIYILQNCILHGQRAMCIETLIWPLWSQKLNVAFPNYSGIGLLEE